MKSKKLLILYCFLFVVAVILMIVFAKLKGEQSSLPRDFEEIKQEGVLRLITEYNQTGYYIDGDTIKGFQYELGKAISKLSGLEVEILLEMNLTTSFDLLNKRECDIIARNLPITSELKDHYLFSDVISLNKQVLIQRTAEANDGLEPLRNQLDLAGKTLYVPKGSPALLRLRNLEQEIGDSIDIVEEQLYSSEQLIIMVANKEIDYAVCDQQIAQRSLEQFKEIDTETDISFTQLQSWVLRKESPILLDSLNSWFQQIQKNGQYTEIYSRYYK